MSQYWKAIIAAVVAIAIVGVQAWQSAIADGEWTTEDTVVTALAILGAIAVYAKANTAPAGQPAPPHMSVADGRDYVRDAAAGEHRLP